MTVWCKIPFMPTQRTLTTERLLLRPYLSSDAVDVQRLAGDREIASTTLLVPHPYEDGLAEKWIATHDELFERGTQVNFAIVLRSTAQFIGSIGLVIEPASERAEMGYWVGKPYWGHGYCTEAAAAVLEYGFLTQGLNRIGAHHFARNPASGRVMQKLGMRLEGVQRQYHKKWGQYEDRVGYAILREEYPPTRKLTGGA